VNKLNDTDYKIRFITNNQVAGFEPLSALTASVPVTLEVTGIQEDSIDIQMAGASSIYETQIASNSVFENNVRTDCVESETASIANLTADTRYWVKAREPTATGSGN